MDNFIPPEFDLDHRNRSDEALKKWRKAVGKLVKNRRRRFRYAADLEKRSEAKEQLKKLSVRIFMLLFPTTSLSQLFVLFNLIFPFIFNFFSVSSLKFHLILRQFFLIVRRKLFVALCAWFLKRYLFCENWDSWVSSERGVFSFSFFFCRQSKAIDCVKF